jgi:hypothetical protein
MEEIRMNKRSRIPFRIRAAAALAALTLLLPLAGGALAAAGGVPESGGNSRPIARNLEYETFAGVAVTGKLTAVDPEGDLLMFSVLPNAKKGSVTLGEDGSFVYTPADGKRGRDSFTYTAADGKGGISAPATVTVNIQRQSGQLTYADMQGHPACYAALRLAQEGVFLGEKLGSERFFRPDAPVTRGEFLAMCLEVCEIGCEDAAARTGFYDDAEIDAWLKPYVSAAVLCGVVEGEPDGEGLPVFRADRTATFAEAAVMLSNALELADVSYLTLAGEDCPSWAYQATVNLVSCGVIASAAPAAYRAELTRAQAAELLLGAMQTVKARKSGVNLFGWLS